jgi:hypothetical protein
MLNPEAPRARYVEIDGAWHEIGEDEHTTSGLVIPPLATWVEELPEGAELAGEPAETPKAKPKGKKK